MPSFKARVAISDEQLSATAPAHTLRLSVDGDIRDDWSQLEWETVIRHWLLSEAVAVSASYGYATFDYDPPSGQSPYEIWAGLAQAQTLGDVATQVRGYYWGNLLTRGHPAKLGGADRTRMEAPVAIVETVELGSETGLYLQLTEHESEVTDQGLRQLRRFLSPLLPAARPGRRAPKAAYRLVEPG
jgi:hypothetical protein